MNEKNFYNGSSPRAAEVDPTTRAANPDERMHRSR